MALEAADMVIMLAANARRDVRSAAERRRLLEQADAELLALPPSPDRELSLSDVRSMQALLATDSGHYTAAVPVFEQALAYRRASSDPDTGDIDYTLSTLGVYDGRITEGLGAMIDVARRARAAQQESLGVTAFRWTTATATRVMAYEVARECLVEGMRYSAEIEQSYCRHVMAAASSHLDWAAGRWDDAVATAGIELVENGSRRGKQGSRDTLGFVAFGRGQLERARELLQESLDIGLPSAEVELVFPAMWGLAETALLAGSPEEAFARCEAALELAETTEERALLVPFVVTGVRAALAARRPDAAEAWLERLRDLLAGWTSLAKHALDHGDGLIRTSAGSTIVARASLEAALVGWVARGRIWEASWARLDLAACLLRSNREGEALEPLRAVRALADELDSVAAADARGRAARDGPQSRRRGGALAAAHRPRVRGRTPGRGRPDERDDRRGAPPVAAHGRRPRGAHPRQARVHASRRDRGLGGRDGRRRPGGRRRLTAGHEAAADPWRSHGSTALQLIYSPNVLLLGLQERPGFCPMLVRNARVALSIWPQFWEWPGTPLTGFSSRTLSPSSVNHWRSSWPENAQNEWPWTVLSLPLPVTSPASAEPAEKASSAATVPAARKRRVVLRAVVDVMSKISFG